MSNSQLKSSGLATGAGSSVQFSWAKLEVTWNDSFQKSWTCSLSSSKHESLFGLDQLKVLTFLPNPLRKSTGNMPRLVKEGLFFGT